MSEEVKIKVPGKLQYIQTVKMAVGSLAGSEGFDVEAVDDIKMAVAEACKCITCHNRAFWSKDYEITVTIEEKGIKIVIEDGKERHDVPKEKCVCVDCPKEGDLSISVIRSLMDEVSVEEIQDEARPESGCKVISMVKYRESDAG